MQIVCFPTWRLILYQTIIYVVHSNNNITDDNFDGLLRQTVRVQNFSIIVLSLAHTPGTCVTLSLLEQNRNVSNVSLLIVEEQAYFIVARNVITFSKIQISISRFHVVLFMF